MRNSPAIPRACPACGQPSVRRIAYGLPTPETMSSADRDEVILGCCLVSEDFPTWRCLTCGHSDKPGMGIVDEVD